MMREKLFSLANKVGFVRVKTCCEGVEYKVCSADEWRGDLESFAKAIENEATAELRARVAELENIIPFGYVVSMHLVSDNGYRWRFRRRIFYDEKEQKAVAKQWQEKCDEYNQGKQKGIHAMWEVTLHTVNAIDAAMQEGKL